MKDLIVLAFSAFLVQNIILSQFLGICSFLGVSNKRSSAIGMGLAVFFVITLSGGVTWLVYYKLLVPFEITFMRTIIFILVVAAMVQIIEMVIKKILPPLYESLGVYLPLITTNCAVLGVSLLNIQNDFSSFLGRQISLTTVVGGFHLRHHNDKQLLKFNHALHEQGIIAAAPLHCCGSDGKEIIRKEFSGTCHELKAGSTLTL